ncbi:MAG: flagellum-specific ATP synthase FliI, partial [Hoeflea sp.]|nr:flagellum-specific ATP synthase FliI [Hoeflea sp.]
MHALIEEVSCHPSAEVYGRVAAIKGLLVEVVGPIPAMSIGSQIEIDTGTDNVHCEVVGFRGDRALCMPFAALEGVRMGCKALTSSAEAAVRPTRQWLGRVVNAFGEPIDGKGPLPSGAEAFRLRNRPPPAHRRQRVGGPIDLGVRALNSFATCCRGQRMGIFAGS